MISSRLKNSAFLSLRPLMMHAMMWKQPHLHWPTWHFCTCSCLICATLMLVASFVYLFFIDFCPNFCCCWKWNLSLFDWREHVCECTWHHETFLVHHLDTWRYSGIALCWFASDSKLMHPGLIQETDCPQLWSDHSLWLTAVPRRLFS